MYWLNDKRDVIKIKALSTSHTIKLSNTSNNQKGLF